MLPHTYAGGEPKMVQSQLTRDWIAATKLLGICKQSRQVLLCPNKVGVLACGRNLELPEVLSEHPR